MLFGNCERNSQLGRGIMSVVTLDSTVQDMGHTWLLWTRYWTFGFQKTWGVPCLFFRIQLLGYRSWREWGRQPHSQVLNYSSAVISFSTTLRLGVSLVASSCAQRWHGGMMHVSQAHSLHVTVLIYYRLDSRYYVVQHTYTHSLHVMTKLYYTKGGTEWGLSEPRVVYRWNPSPL